MQCKDFNDDYQFLDNSQDIESILEMVGLAARETVFNDIEVLNKSDGGWYEVAGSLFVLQHDGEILEVYGHDQSVPCLFLDYELLFRRETDENRI